jgi:hypothetical protein
MSYSRRQLYALGETLGECVTRRKADGGLILGGGGSSAPSSPTQTQTSIQELPSWAKPYAQTTLEKASALTSQPYVPYTENRIAGFTPLQQQAQTQAANMTPAEQLGQGSALAGTAGLGGLGVAGQANPQGFQQNVLGYMNPYLEGALAPQIREANRQYDITGTRQQGAATQAGAFGGSREAIMAAENERNRNMGIQNIVGQGYNTAFNQAQNQYNQGLQNQLAGYGLAGQAAGQLGQLGQTQYGQQMGINQLQNQYGTQQQQLQQQGLTQAYQDFLNQQNYPYKQLGFMSDIIRGLPLGQQSASNVYQGAGSPLGQIAGIGAGLAGAFGRAEGGMVNSYAGGGNVDSASNIAGILSKLSDEQLKQAKQAALSRQDVEEADLIDQEMAHRASMRQGINAAPVDASQMASDENPESITGYAAGGESTSDDEKLSEQKKSDREALKNIAATGLSAAGDVVTAIPRGLAGAVNSAIIRPARAISNSDIPYIFGDNPELTESLTPFYDKFVRGKGSKPVDTTKAPDGEKPSTYTEPKTAEDIAAMEARIRMAMGKQPTDKVAVKPSGGPKISKPAAGSITEALNNQKPQTQAKSLDEQAMDIYKKFHEMSSADLKSLNDAIEAQKGEADKIKDRGLSNALMQYGFGMAAAASKPGARFLGSAAAAAPAFGEAMARNEDLQRAARDNYLKLKMDHTKYQVALDKGDMQSATALAAQIRQGDMQQKQLDALVDYQNKHLALQEKQLGLQAAHLNQGTSIQQIANDLMAHGFQGTREQALERASGLAGGVGLRSETALTQRLSAAVQKALEGDFGYKTLGINIASEKDPVKKQQLIRDRENYIRNVEAEQRRIMGLNGTSGNIGAGTSNPNIKVLGPA